ncbi:MAG: glycosyltransferase family 4 protein [Ardenticatenaceae bacterium]|nr:glycosyltransferase family 4 protein [Ardenticatenaceae bacterium]
MIGPFGLHPNKTMESRALGLARPLVANGHSVRLIMPPWHTPDEADKTWEVDGVEMRYVPLRGGTVGITRQMVTELLAWRPDVVHCFKPKAYSGLVAWLLWHFHRRQLRLFVDSDDWEGWGGWNDLAPYSPPQKQFFAWQEQWGMRHCHGLTVASRTLQSLAWGAGVPPERVVYLPNGAGIQTFEIFKTSKVSKTSDICQHLGQRPVLLLYSRLFEFDTARLVAILRGVKTAVPDLAILTVGAGLYAEDAAAFRAQITAVHLQDAFVEAGWVDVDELPALLACADVGIYLMDDTLLNRTKCPVKLADMVAVGLPVVAEAVGQVPEYVVDGYNGRLRPSGDVAGLTADLVALLQQKEERQRLGENGRLHYQTHFAWAQLAQRLEELYLR